VATTPGCSETSGHTYAYDACLRGTTGHTNCDEDRLSDTTHNIKDGGARPGDDTT